MKRLIAALLAGIMAMLMLGVNINITHIETPPVNPAILQLGKILVTDFNEHNVVKFLNATNEIKDYHLIIQSSGGSVVHAIAMLNRIQDLQRQGAHVTTEVYGAAQSAGAYVFLAGDTRIIHSGAQLLYHGAGIMFAGERMDVKKMIEEGEPRNLPMTEHMTWADEMVMQMFRDKTTLTEKDIQHWMYFEDYNMMSSEEAFEINVATEIR